MPKLTVIPIGDFLDMEEDRILNGDSPEREPIGILNWHNSEEVIEQCDLGDTTCEACN